VRISAQLVQANPEKNLWTDSYERDLSDVLALQGEVARGIVEEIQVNLLPQEQRRLLATRAVKPDAYEAYLKGRYFWNKRDRQAVMEGLKHFQRAVELDPTYALAHVGVADSYVVIGGNIWLSPHEAFPKAKAEALNALEIDNTSSEAHASLAMVKQLAWDWDGVENEYKTALALNPGYAIAHQWYSLFLSETGRHEQAVEEARRATELDPLSPIISFNLGQVLCIARRYEGAREALQRTLEISPGFYPALEFLGLVAVQQHKFAEAIAQLQKAASASPEEDMLRAELADAYALSGRSAEAQRVLSDLKEQWRKGHASAYSIALVCAALGKNEEAIAWLEEAYRRRDSEFPWISAEPMFDPLRTDSRFSDLVARVRFPS